MANRDQLVAYLDEYLAVNEIQDYGPQGLQVEGKETVSQIITGVSLSLELIDLAVQKKADMILVHHGLLWNKETHVIKGHFKKRIYRLLQHEITLLAYHLPLDKHETVGNNWGAAKALGFSNLVPFGQVGVRCQSLAIDKGELFQKLKSLYQSDALVFDFGPETIRSIAITSGGGAKEFQLAIDLGLDAFITGEPSEPALALAKENKIHFIAAGHYATEKIGVQLLGKHITHKFGIPVTFIDIPNPV